MAIEFDSPPSPKSITSRSSLDKQLTNSSSSTTFDLPPLTGNPTQQSTRSIRFANIDKPPSPTPHSRIRPKSSTSSLSTTTSEKGSLISICTCRSRPQQRYKEKGTVHKAASGVVDFVLFLLCAGCVIGTDEKKKNAGRQQRWCLRCGGKVC